MTHTIIQLSLLFICGFCVGVFACYDVRRRKINTLTTLNADMDYQIRELLKRKCFTDDQYADILQRMSDHRELVTQTGLVTTYLRETYPAEFATGHGNATFSQVVIGYLKKGEQK